MTIKEKILNDYIFEKALLMRTEAISNINKEINTRIIMRCPQSKIQKLLDLREKILNNDVEEFMNLNFEDLDYFVL